MPPPSAGWKEKQRTMGACVLDSASWKQTMEKADLDLTALAKQTACPRWLRFFRLEEINGAERCPTYLYRWTLFQPRRPRWLWRGFGIYLHKFVGDDWSRDLHDHPKRFISIGLKGRYVEWIPGLEPTGWPRRIYTAPWLRTFPAAHIHRLTLMPDRQPCWTLVIVLRSVREWGFWHDGQWIHWKDYVRGSASHIADKMRACI
jgi:hypothetical protein